MATIFLGKVSGAVGFARVVAIKRLHENFARDANFVAMFVDEARLAARIRHPNVVSTLDVEATANELFVVMEYVHGLPLAQIMTELAARGERVPPRIAATLLSGVLQGLHAAHTAVDDEGTPLNIIHRDVSPQNILVGVDGLARLIDFGVAKAQGSLHQSKEDHVNGKLAYMAPEQVRGADSLRADLYAVGVVLWEALVGRRLFEGTEGAVLAQVLIGKIPKPSSVDPDLAPFDAIIQNSVTTKPGDRYPTALAMARDLEQCLGLSSTLDVAAWIEPIASSLLSERASLVSQVAAMPIHEAKDQVRELVRRAATPNHVGDHEASSVVLRHAEVELRTEATSTKERSSEVVKGARRWWIGGGALLITLLAIGFIQWRDAHVPPPPAKSMSARSEVTQLPTPIQLPSASTPEPSAEPTIVLPPSPSSAHSTKPKFRPSSTKKPFDRLGGRN